jgi:hypothetical protein
MNVSPSPTDLASDGEAVLAAARDASPRPDLSALPPAAVFAAAAELAAIRDFARLARKAGTLTFRDIQAVARLAATSFPIAQAAADCAVALAEADAGEASRDRILQAFLRRVVVVLPGHQQEAVLIAIAALGPKTAPAAAQRAALTPAEVLGRQTVPARDEGDQAQ